MSLEETFYEQAELFVAGLRVYVHLFKAQPTVEELAEFLKISRDKLHFINNRLEQSNIVKTVSTAFDQRIYLKDIASIQE
jgi:predicted transcriptional regulator